MTECGARPGDISSLPLSAEGPRRGGPRPSAHGPRPPAPGASREPGRLSASCGDAHPEGFPPALGGRHARPRERASPPHVSL